MCVFSTFHSSSSSRSRSHRIAIRNDAQIAMSMSATNTAKTSLAIWPPPERTRCVCTQRATTTRRKGEDRSHRVRCPTESETPPVSFDSHRLLFVSICREHGAPGMGCHVYSWVGLALRMHEDRPTQTPVTTRVACGESHPAVRVMSRSGNAGRPATSRVVAQHEPRMMTLPSGWCTRRRSAGMHASPGGSHEPSSSSVAGQVGLGVRCTGQSHVPDGCP
mmetsp:Transcript_24740/g.86114  ORF Transcript_24740/g.86114 Transcript_24740/m.86114 type:complete len:220 (-) Transcript_24740:1220-1879(-)